MSNKIIAGSATGATALPIASTIDGSLDYLPIYTASATATQAINRNTLLGLASTPLGLSDTQSPTNKTFDNTNSLTIKDGSLTLQNTSSTTKQTKFSLASITAGQTRTITVPDYNLTLASQAGVETLTNKTLTSPTINSPTIVNATLSADAITGYTTSNTGTIYGGISVSTGNVSLSGTLGVTGLLTPTGGLSTNSVSAAALATNAITLGYAQITSTFTGAGNTNPQQVTGLTATVTIPAGSRRIKITAYSEAVYSSTGAAIISVSIWDGVVNSGTQLTRQVVSTPSSTTAMNCTAIWSGTPAAGSKTYNVGVATSNASNVANMEAAATYPAFILVEVI